MSRRRLHFGKAARGWAAIIASLSLVTLACQLGNGTSACAIRAQDYDRSCSVDTDCAAVTEVAGCGGCACLTGAVNQRALAKYRTDLAQPLSAAGLSACNCPCEAVAPHCCGGVCTNLCGCPAGGGAGGDGAVNEGSANEGGAE